MANHSVVIHDQHNPMNVVFFLTLLIPGADPVPQDAELVQAWLKVSLKHAQDYVIHPDGQPDRPFTMLPQAVFRHSQPVRGDDIGAVYLWVDADKRPAVIGTTFAYTYQGESRAVVHEFHSLADGPLTVNWRGQQRWHPMQAGLQFQPVTETPPVATDSKARQRQVREIARRFAANSVDPQGGRWELRMVPKPIHQFDVEKPENILCGTLFLFCQGTDPELILTIEARRQENPYQWHFAAASFTDYGLKLRFDDKEVWADAGRSTGPTKPHWSESVSKERLPKEAR